MHQSTPMVFVPSLEVANPDLKLLEGTDHDGQSSQYEMQFQRSIGVQESFFNGSVIPNKAGNDQSPLLSSIKVIGT